MNIAPIYELKSRLRAAAIAGTNLLSEDFRLKKAVEGFAPLEKASPIFAKIGEMTRNLLAYNSPTNLLDTITLVDSVITTLGTVEVKDEIEDLPLCEFDAEIMDIPYSKLKALIDALTTSGSGKFNYIGEMWRDYPELFNDYRVSEPIVRGLGAKYSGTSELAERIVEKIGSRIMPLLKKGFDPKGGSEMLRRFNFIEDFGGAAENEFYLANLDDSEKLMRRRIIYALRLDAGNLDKLIELSKIEKGKFKQAALGAILNIDSPEAEKYIREYAQKKPYEIFTLIGYASSRWTSVLTAELMEQLLVDSDGIPRTLSQSPNKIACKNKATFEDCVYALNGKFGPEIEKIYRDFRSNEHFDPTKLNRQTNMFKLDRVLGDSIVLTGDKGLMKLAVELNTKSEMKNKFPQSEVFARIMGEEDCLPWLKKKLDNIPKDKELDNDCLLSPLERVYFRNGECVVMSWMYPDNIIIERPRINYGVVRQSVNEILDLILAYYKGDDGDWTKRGRYFVDVIVNFINPEDEEMCKHVSDYVQSFPLESCDRAIFYKCGTRNVKGLAYAFVKDRSEWDAVWMDRLFNNTIFGDHDYKVAEAEQLIELFRKGKMKAKANVKELENWLDQNRESL